MQAETEAIWDGGSCLVTLTQGLPKIESEVLHEEQILEPSAADRVEQLISYHVEQCNELMFPSRSQEVGMPERYHGLTRYGWDAARRVYWRPDDQEGALRLIVRIAEQCSALLQDVCCRPRRALRRARQSTRIERVQQMDDTCVRWLVRRPGRTLLEKSGPRRRVLAVERVESADTPENRVLRDFLERSLRESVRYLLEQRERQSSPRYRTVQRFRSLVVRLLRHTEIGEVPRVAGVPQANYVLQFDSRYAPLWLWYERLRRQQNWAEEARRWRRRLLVEHLRFALADARSDNGEPIPMEKRVYLRADHDRGHFLDARTVLGPWSRVDGGYDYLLTATELEQASRQGLVSASYAAAGCDLGILSQPESRLTLCFARLIISDKAAGRRSPGARRMAEYLDRIGVPDSAGVLLFVGDPAAELDGPVWLEEERSLAGRWARSLRVPVPPRPGVRLLRGMLQDRGIFP